MYTLSSIPLFFLRETSQSIHNEDNKHITEVTNPRVIETGYRSLQLTLWTLGADEWFLFKKLPDYAARTKRKRGEVIQLPFPDLDEKLPQAVSS